ncbi:MFS-type transporter [Rickettsia bellii RML369-C]|uniref:MFS-type transporter n=2 Tax=Rickettsia bellii TaxID=33990 RepID=Q1RHQ0_RICBR|nr:MFS-type transporter [Rickettsia bellii RML369-C]
MHMAVLLNKIFFSPDNSYSIKVLSAFAYCSTFIFRPFGALLFGWIGDNIGRKPVILIATFLMACTCIGIAVLPSYDEIGFTATVLITLFRAIQGISSATEVTGAQLYITEMVKPPLQYPAVASTTIFSTLGTLAALGIAAIVTSGNFNWRYAFLFGAFVAVTGLMARTTLKETRDFIDAKRRIKLSLEKTGIDPKKIESNSIIKEKTNFKTFISYFAIQCTWPVWSYFGYFYCGNILTENFGYSPAEVIHHNFFISMIELTGTILLVYLSYKIYPLKILRATFYILIVFFCFSPVIMQNLTPSYIMLIQVYFLVFAPGYFPATAIFYKHFPVFKRFMHTSFIFAMSRALMYIITSFGLAYLTEYFGYWGILMIMIPVTIGYYLGLRHFENLEKNMIY